jgi:arylsulfatase A-like enzyme
MNMNRTLLVMVVAVAACAASRRPVDGAAVAAADSGKSSRPNIIFFLADDYGLDGVGCYGSDSFKTPNIDALARSGLRFENAYCTPLCGPTRCLFITGRYGFRTGGMSNQSAGRPTPNEEPSIAKMLKQAGYATGHCGKWRQMGATPGDWGFDEYITDPTAGGYYWQSSYTKNGELVNAGKEIYYPDLCHEFARDFIERNRERPFFFYYASHLVHGPILRTPDTQAGNADPDRLYADNVAYLDKQVGDLVAHIDRLGLREKTLILFTADNGTARRSRTLKGRELSGQKGGMLDCGAHVPLIASWKGTAPAGKVLADLVDFSDMFPTFAELAGGHMPAGVTFDGKSFTPQLRGQPGTPREWIFVQLGANWYVREKAWKLNNHGELFDMTDAPFVEKSIAADTRDGSAAAARQRLQAVLDQLAPAKGKIDVREPKAKQKRKQKRKVSP